MACTQRKEAHSLHEAEGQEIKLSVLIDPTKNSILYLKGNERATIFIIVKKVILDSFLLVIH